MTRLTARLASTILPVLSALVMVGAPSGAAMEEPLGGEAQVNVSGPGEQHASRVATDAAGNFLVAWEDCAGACGAARYIRARLYDRLRTPLTGTIDVRFGLHARPAVAALPDGWLTAWVKLPDIAAMHEDIVGQRLDGAGNLVGGEVPISTGLTYKGAPSIASNEAGEFVVVWSSPDQDGSGSGIFGRHFDSTGVPVGGEFAANAYTTGDQSAPSVATAPDGSFLVVWSGAGAGDPSGVFGRWFDSSGSPQVGDIQINAYTTGTQANPDVGVDGAGGFVVVWSGATIQGEAEGVAVREVDAGGTPLGAFESQVNLTTPGAQAEAAVAVETPGNYVVAWSDASGLDGSGTGVYAHRYNRLGIPAGERFRVNTHTAGDQFSPAIAAAYAGGFVVTWTSNGQDDPMEPTEGGIFLQAYTTPRLISGRKLRIKDNADPSRRKLRILSRSGLVSARPIEGGPELSNNGAFLHVYNGGGGGDSACLALPASGWSVAGDPGEPIFRYKDRAFANGPCKKVLLKQGKLKATCLAKIQPISYSLDEPAQGSVVVRLLSAGWDTCAVFGGTVTESSAQFHAKDAPVPGACGGPPAPCP